MSEAPPAEPMRGVWEAGPRWRGRPSLEWIGARTWRLIDGFAFHSRALGWIELPAGFVSDLISLPGVGRLVFRVDGPELPAALIHDFLYVRAGRDRFPTLTRRRADLVFLEALAELGVARWRRWLMVAAVRAFGWRSYRDL